MSVDSAGLSLDTVVSQATAHMVSAHVPHIKGSMWKLYPWVSARAGQIMIYV